MSLARHDDEDELLTIAWQHRREVSDDARERLRRRLLDILLAPPPRAQCLIDKGPLLLALAPSSDIVDTDGVERADRPEGRRSGKEREMEAAVGSRIVVESEKVAQSARCGVIEEVLQVEPPRYRVRWDDGRTGIITPASGAARIERGKARRS
jgi:hypothetical protein